MQLIDKDLLSMQEVRELVEAAKEAQQELARMDQAQVDRIVRAIADAGVRNARRLAQMANEDTGFGIVDDKVIKNIFASRGVYEHIKDMKTIGEISRDDAKRLRTIAVPVGVIAGLIPPPTPLPPHFTRRRSPSRRATPSCSPPPHGPALHPGDRQGHPAGGGRGGRQ